MKVPLLSTTQVAELVNNCRRCKAWVHPDITMLIAPTRVTMMQQEGFIDNEIVQGFMVMDYKGPLDVCQAEVEEVEWQPFETVRSHNPCLLFSLK